MASVEVAGRMMVSVGKGHWRLGAKKGLFVVVGVLHQSCGGKRVDWLRFVDHGKRTWWVACGRRLQAVAVSHNELAGCCLAAQ